MQMCGIKTDGQMSPVTIALLKLTGWLIAMRNLRLLLEVSPRRWDNKKGELWNSSPYWTVLDSHYKSPIARNFMIALVAGGGFEPPTFGL